MLLTQFQEHLHSPKESFEFLVVYVFHNIPLSGILKIIRKTVISNYWF
jgi:hypothetical protein